MATFRGHASLSVANISINVTNFTDEDNPAFPLLIYSEQCRRAVRVPHAVSRRTSIKILGDHKRKRRRCDLHEPNGPARHGVQGKGSFSQRVLRIGIATVAADDCIRCHKGI